MSLPSAKTGVEITDEEVPEMMPCNALQSGGLGTAERASEPGGGTSTDAGFLTDLVAQIEKETGDKIDPQVLADWLKEHSNDDPAITPDGLLPLLERLMDPSVAMSSAAQAPNGGSVKNPAALLERLMDPSVAMSLAAQAPNGSSVKDPAALLERLIAASGGLVQATGKAGEPAAGRLLAALHAGHDGPPLLEQANANADPSPNAPAVFQHLLQSAATTVPGSPALPVAENGAGIPSLQVTTPVTQAGFGGAVGDRLLWMVQHEVPHARLQLNPPGLGPLDITVSLHDGQVSIALNAHHVLTREALAADAPRLRGLLADAGFGAVDVNVSSQNRGRGDQPPSGAAPHGFIPADASAAAESVGRVQGERPLYRSRSLVDHYA